MGASSSATLIERGNALLARRAAREAAQCFVEALKREPDSRAARFGVGVALLDLGDLQGARRAFNAVVAVSPGHAAAHFNLGFIAFRLGESGEAERHFVASLAKRPDHVPTLVHLGILAMRFGRFDEAISHLTAALSRQPDQPAIRGRLGAALLAVGRVVEAVPLMQAADAGGGGDPFLTNQFALALHTLGDHDEAIAALRKCLSARPDAAGLHSNLLVMMHFSERETPESIYAEHLDWAQRHAVDLPAVVAHPNDRDLDRMLQIGLVTPHVTAGPVPTVLTSLLLHHDRGAVAYTLYANSDGADATTDRLQSLVSRVRRVRQLSDEELAAQVRSDGIDILIDLAGHTGGDRLLAFARKPAPVQVSWLDYFDTTGLPAMDYVLTDPTSTPAGGPQRFVEQLLRMPVTRLCFTLPEGAPDVASLPALRCGHLTFGSFNRYSKITPPVVELWSRLLNTLPGSRLILKASEFQDPGIVDLARTRFAAHVDLRRLEFRGRSPYREMLAEYADVDIALDTFPHNGGATTMDALAMGVPVLTRAGDTMISRQSAAMLHACGLGGFVADTADQFIAIAARWNSDLAGLATLRNGMRARIADSTLTDGRRFARDFEAVMRQAWRGWAMAPLP